MKPIKNQRIIYVKICRAFLEAERGRTREVRQQLLEAVEENCQDDPIDRIEGEPSARVLYVDDLIDKASRRSFQREMSFDQIKARRALVDLFKMFAQEA